MTITLSDTRGLLVVVQPGPDWQLQLRPGWRVTRQAGHVYWVER